ncbi:hypothetical protein PF005_g11532 [Phytophthora fragariae]|uniref:Secreted protein n=1 Tax=Phytophthora fragariae TaxID=53985 RepID=A0A6A3XTD8_9STRA|nr:hypothetical protein PF003_g17604 [Phytophthora fragariae]KAE9107842.1 hypothetical protein PF010_g12127 [Phytophthora fragariae]KAE9143769.1 hypothetical protein PF006_g11229 [Phytophthora fragariae]KAE9206868.1 hypothetical protein PF002_g19869 [Phytophthora fragariae]KAE9210164.1 hypothetical protein PF005_g11532 [Phytophthora fragariae]
MRALTMFLVGVHWTPSTNSIGWCHICSRYAEAYRGISLREHRIWSHETPLTLDLCNEPILKTCLGNCILYADHHSTATLLT